MNKVIHDQPDDPLIYLIKVLHKKAGLEVPRDLKAHGVRKSSPERIGKQLYNASVQSRIRLKLELMAY